MTRRATLLALASRAEEASGADREIDALIGGAAGFDFQEEWGGAIRLPAPNYTASLDAALGLVPEGLEVGLYSDDSVIVFRRRERTGGFDIRGESHTHDRSHVPIHVRLATALCAAALRSLAALEADSTEGEQHG